MECKWGVPVTEVRKPYLELIETLWNVNEFTEQLKEGRLTELIETLWNVNETDWRSETRGKL